MKKPPSACTSNLNIAWNDYIDGHVVSRNAVRIITSLLLQTIAATQIANEEVADDDKDETDVEDEIPPLKLSIIDFRKLFQSSVSHETGDAKTKPFKQKLANTLLESEFRRQQQIGQRVWQTPTPIDPDLSDTNPGAQIEDMGAKHLAARKQGAEASSPSISNTNPTRIAEAKLRDITDCPTLDSIWTDISRTRTFAKYGAKGLGSENWKYPNNLLDSFPLEIQNLILN